MLRRLVHTFLTVLAAARARLAAVRTRLVTTEAGQTTAEYALVILGAAALGTLLITWASHSHAITKLFDTVIGKVLP
ncbi:MAG TPA: DUF4244 domain-containing protein [Acidimicrobiia bacterium]|nr:DUF4244 domain-containing protein [Acidimicrobiia bacterium]